jgi:sugar/nucleoside kinase (ribokinase family)
VDLLTVGEAFEDLIFAGLTRLPRLGEEVRVQTLTRHPGGGAVLTAIGAARLGLTVGTISAVSAETRTRLGAEQVTLIDLRRPTERGAVSVALSTAHDRAFVTYEGVNRVLEPRLLGAFRHGRRRARHVHFALGPQQCRAWLPIVERLRAHGTTTSWDFGWNERLLEDPALDRLIAAVDWVFVNELEATLYARAATLRSSMRYWRTTPRNAVLKLGQRGAMALAGKTKARELAPTVRVTDTTGAGDAFNAGFLAALLSHAPLTSALRLGNLVGSQSTRAIGGVDGLPRRAQLPAWSRRLLDSAA